MHIKTAEFSSDWLREYSHACVPLMVSVCLIAGDLCYGVGCIQISIWRAGDSRRAMKRKKCYFHATCYFAEADDFHLRAHILICSLSALAAAGKTCQSSVDVQKLGQQKFSNLGLCHGLVVIKS